MVQATKILFGVALALFSVVSAHPGHDHHPQSATEHAQRKLFAENGMRSLAACANSQHARALRERTLERRTNTIRQLRQEREQRRLSAETALNTSHKSNLTGVNKDTDPAVLFGSETKCILEPEVTEGPYYVNGELIRTDIREDQVGVDLYTELQIVDVNTCEPVENLYIDFWHCNSTGVYAGVVAASNGNPTDASNINTTFNRGLAPTDKEGLVTFLTTFPGHYTGRAVHIHVLGSYGGSRLENNTYVGGSASHVGQIFFDENLISQVEATPIYSTNKQPLLANARDRILLDSAATGFDPFVEYAFLGNSVEDGIFSWISIGVDMKISKKPSAASTFTANGGVANPVTPRTGGGSRPPSTGSGAGIVQPPTVGQQ